ncbi:MAG: c-type cytochrome [Clostridia bacterium]|nr:c-type cytochrome [Clostridia bacterium]
MAQEIVYKLTGVLIIVVIVNFIFTWLFLLRKKEAKINGFWFFVPAFILIFTGFSFLAFPKMQFRLPVISTEADYGKILLESRCLRCHRLGGQGADFAPNLADVKGEFNSRDELVNFLQKPAGKTPGMPRQNLTGKEIEGISESLWREWAINSSPRDGQKVSPDKVTRGEALFQYRCQGCHRIGSKGGAAGPDLDKVIGNYSREDLMRFFHERSANSSGKAMPKFSLKEEDMEALVAYLAWEKEKAALEKGLTEGAGNLGPAIMTARGCLGCHSLEKKGGSMGPRLDQIGRKRDKAWLKDFLKNSVEGDPQRTMPTVDLKPEEIEAIGEYLAGLK